MAFMQTFVKFTSWYLTCERSPAGGQYEWPLPAQPNRTGPWIRQTDPHIGLAGTSGRRPASTPSPEDIFARLNVVVYAIKKWQR